MSRRKGASGARQGVIRYSGPVSAGIQYRSGIPLPLNHRTKRVSIALSRSPAAPAYAAPLALNIETSGGSPTLTPVPISVKPFKNLRRDNLPRLVLMLDTGRPPFRGNHQVY